MTELEKMILELVDRGFALPERLKRNPEEGFSEWVLRDYHPAGGWEQTIAHADAHAMIGSAFLDQVQGYRPALRTTIHGDWYLELEGKAPAPATHWDIPHYETIIRSVHASGLQPRGYK